MTWRVAVLPGDGIGPEVTAQAVRVLAQAMDYSGHQLQFDYALCGGAAIEAHGHSLPPETMALCRDSDAVLLGAVGGPKWDHLPLAQRPERSLLELRAGLGLFANLRPVRLHPAMAELSPLRPSILGMGVDLIICRELTGGLYYGDRARVHLEGGGQRASDTMTYSSQEIERVARVAFALAQQRRGTLTSVDKANVLECSRLWRETVADCAIDYPQVEVKHLYVDDCAARLIQQPGSFDVLLTENTFGDILSDLGAVLAGSMGLLPSASLGVGSTGLYEPVHGAAPDLIGKNLANPVGAILSGALLLRHSLGLGDLARLVEESVDRALAEGWRTCDVAIQERAALSTQEMGDKVLVCMEEIWRERGGRV